MRTTQDENETMLTVVDGDRASTSSTCTQFARSLALLDSALMAASVIYFLQAICYFMEILDCPKVEKI